MTDLKHALSLPRTGFRPGESQDTWAQREYVQCINEGLGFTAHSKWWHYKVGDRCASWSKDRYSGIEHTLWHEFKPGLNWITQCVKAVSGVKEQR